MISFVPILLGILSVAYCLKLYLQFRRHLKAAKTSGIAYTIVPFYLANRLWQLSGIVTLPILRSLPHSWTEPWLPLTQEWGWKRRYSPFAYMGADTFLSVSPERNVLYTCEASVITQITQRRNDFPKALEVYGMLEIYGRNVVTTEGQEWRHQRKITSPQFNEANNHLVWEESLSQTKAMVDSWFGQDKERSPTIRTLADDAMRLSLHIISRAGFGVGLVWPGSEDESEKEVSKQKDGHTMTYTEALGTLLENIVPIMVTPKFLLSKLPFEATEMAHQAYNEWGRYMWEMFHEKKALVLGGKEDKSGDLMIAMLKGAGVSAQAKGEGKEPATQTLTDQEIIGNSFVFILAGHETTANAIHFCMAYLAMQPSYQRRLQKDLDATFKGRPISEWDYDQYIGPLFSGWAGAVMNEELRLVPPVTSIPKCTEPGKPQPLIVAEKHCTVPENTYVALMPHAAHRNPNQWPTGPPADPDTPSHPYSNQDNDLEEFKPDRWFKQGDTLQETRMPAAENKSAETNTLGINTAADTAPTLYRPPKGAYLPFSEGYRSCIGRRFAQVELLAFLALVFTQYSVELSVEEWVSDETFEKMDEVGRREVWEKAKTKMERQMIYDMYSIITLQLRKGHFALRLVKRGKETFDYQ